MKKLGIFKKIAVALILTLIMSPFVSATDIVVDDVITGNVNTDSLTLNGDVSSTTAIDWDLTDNNVSSLSFDSTGKSGILNLVTTNSAEGVNFSGFADIAGWLGLGSYFDIDEIAAPSNPAADVGRLYVADDGGTTKLYFLDSAGTTTDLLAGGTPAGADTNVQYNDSGAFGAEAAFTYNAGTDTLTAVNMNATTFTGALTGQADTVATITGLAPDTATTAAASGLRK